MNISIMIAVSLDGKTSLKPLTIGLLIQFTLIWFGTFLGEIKRYWGYSQEIVITRLTITTTVLLILVRAITTEVLSYEMA